MVFVLLFLAKDFNDKLFNLVILLFTFYNIVLFFSYNWCDFIVLPSSTILRCCNLALA